MNIQDALELIKSESPQIIYLSGKTSTGKSTFANKLRDEFGYVALGLDDIVYQHVIKALQLKDSQHVFIEVYRQRSKPVWLRRFITAAREEINRAIKDGKKVILEGAVAHPDTLKELLNGYQFLFLYFHPVALERYQQFLLNRFQGSTKDYQNELPLLFWEQFKDSELDQFYMNRELTPAIEAVIERYASISQQESTERLNSFKKDFSDINVVEI